MSREPPKPLTLGEVLAGLIALAIVVGLLLLARPSDAATCPGETAADPYLAAQVVAWAAPSGAANCTVRLLDAAGQLELEEVTLDPLPCQRHEVATAALEGAGTVQITCYSAGGSSGLTRAVSYALACDLDGDGACGIPDLNVMQQAFGSSEGGIGWDARADLTGDGMVGIPDLRVWLSGWP